jgi:hypothetical protein
MMWKICYAFIIAAFALPSLIILITSRNMDSLMLLASLFFNTLWLASIVYIQPIGLGIKIYALYFILFNNIFITIFRLIYINLSINSRIKEFIGKFMGYYLKIFYIYPNYLFRKLMLIISVLNKFSDLLNNRVNNIVYDLLTIEPLKLIDKEYDETSKHTLLTFANNKLLDHKHLFAALFSGLVLEEEFKKVGKKIMIVSISREDRTFNIHKNIIIDENTAVNNYLDKIQSSIQAFYESGYPISTFLILQIKLWDYAPQ